VSVHALGRDVAAAVEEASVSADRVPTDFPESDGTFEWRHTTPVLVEVTADDRRGIGWTYADMATARLARRMLTAAACRGKAPATDPGQFGALGGLASVVSVTHM